MKTQKINFVHKDFWSCTLFILLQLGRQRGVFVQFLQIRSPPFTLEITLNLGNILQGLSWVQLQYSSTYYIQELKFQSCVGVISDFYSCPWDTLLMSSGCCCIQSDFCSGYNQVFLHLTSCFRQGSLYNGVDLNSVHCRGLHINFLL